MREKFMKQNAGLWIDHKEAFLVFVNADGAEATEYMASSMEKHVRFSGHSSEDGAAEDQRDHKFAVHLDKYYDEVIAHLNDAQAIFIFGPGEAKGELKKRLAHKGPGERIVGVETTDKMTEAQVAAKVRDHYKK